jgi:cellulose synthase/poly-beta-1,6-N-acetylglucosamine synthase-like glycosyltransferase
MIASIEVLFWACVITLAYTYVGFGVLAAAWGTVRRRQVRQQPITPSVSIIVAAYNEEAVIKEKLKNLFALEYPSDRLEIIVASDGSSDRTVTIVREHVSEHVLLLALPRRGKIHALKDAVAQAQGDILVFSDANTLMDRHAVSMLVRNFADPDVGGVCGNQLHVTAEGTDSSGQGESLYWTYDKWLKAKQTHTGSIVSADGAIYAIRRELFRSPESAAVTDDFAISTAVVAQGKRLVFEADALAYETPTGDAKREFQRKVRLMTRGMRGVLLRRQLLNPFRYGFYSIVLLSHKVVRRLAPLFLILLLASNLVLGVRGTLYGLTAAVQVAFYMLSGLGFLLRSHPAGRTKLVSIPFFYCLANAAALVALNKVSRGERIERWQPRGRGAEA